MICRSLFVSRKIPSLLDRAIPDQHKFTRTNAIINNSGNTKATSKTLHFYFSCQQNYLPQWLRALTHMQLLIHVLFSFEWLKYQSLSDDF